MAATIAKAIGYDSSRTKETHRLGSQSAEAQANTWRTFCTAYVRKDGSGFVEVKRDGIRFLFVEFGTEDEGSRIDFSGMIAHGVKQQKVEAPRSREQIEREFRDFHDKRQREEVEIETRGRGDA